MPTTMQELDKETKEAIAERAELQNLINEKKNKKPSNSKGSKKPSNSKGKLIPVEEPVKEELVEDDMVDWVEGVFIFRDQPGQVLPFIFMGQRVAIRDGEIAELPLAFADHLNGLKHKELEWVRDGKDSAVGEQGQKRVKSVIPRTEFRITRRFKRHKSVKLKKPERHKM